MFWKGKSGENASRSQSQPSGGPSGGTELSAILVASQRLLGSLRHLIVLPQDPSSIDFEKRLQQYETEFVKMEDNPFFIERSSVRVVESVEEFGRCQRESVDRSLHVLDEGIRSITSSLDSAMRAGNELQSASSATRARLSVLHKVPSYEALVDALKKEVDHLTAAVARHQTHLAEIQQVHSNELSNLHEKLAEAQQVATTDYLTGLGNRASFDEAIVGGVKRANIGETLSFAMIDLDGFKAVNDTYGHAAGDRVLTEIARRLLQTFPKGVQLFRIGGDEFAVLAKGNKENLSTRLQVLNTTFEGDPLTESGRRLNIGLSFGVIQISSGDDADQIVKIADKLMYDHKQSRKGMKSLASDFANGHQAA